MRRQYTIAAPGRTDFPENVESGRPGSISPGPSVCSDIDLPYISYTVNRPIGGKYFQYPISICFRKFSMESVKTGSFNYIINKVNKSK